MTIGESSRSRIRPNGLAARARRATLSIGEPRPLPNNLLAKSILLNFKIVDRVLLMTDHPTREHEERELNGQGQHAPDASLLAKRAKTGLPLIPWSRAHVLQ